MAVASIGPSKLRLPPFSSIENDRKMYGRIAAPFTRQFSYRDEDLTDLPANVVAALGLSILLDQFPRNLFRGSEQVVVYEHYDRLSRAVEASISQLWLDRSKSLKGFPVWRYWLYIPLEHSESIADHKTFCTRLEAMLAQAEKRKDEMGVNFLEKALYYEYKHLDPLRKFGRFPWRNKWLGRPNTKAEQEWLDKGGDTFGTG